MTAPGPTAEQVRDSRLAARMTQREAARLIGYSVRVWQDWEAGRRKMRRGAWRLWIRLLQERSSQ